MTTQLSLAYAQEQQPAPPSRRIAMVWRRTSALDGFLRRLATVIRGLPGDLFEFRPEPSGAHARASARPDA